MLSCCFCEASPSCYSDVQSEVLLFASERNLDVHVGLVLRYTAATFNGS